MSDFGERGRRPGDKPASGRPDDRRPNRGGPDRGGPRDGAPRPDRAPRSDGDSRPRRDGDAPRWSKDSRPQRSDGAGRSSSAGRPGGSGRPSSSGRPDRGGRPDRPGAPRPSGGGYQGRSSRDEFVDPDPLKLRSVRNRHDDPIIPEDVQAKELDRVARAQLKTLSQENADEVARHLVMVARLIESDPALAHQHAVSAARRAGRIGVVRETLAITAYSVGDFALALRELRTYRRISGNNDQLPLMVDSERGLDRADKALELGRSVDRATLPADVQVMLAIAMSGARLDLGQADAALIELQIPQLDPDTAFPWSPALFDAYAAVLEDLGRDDEAEVWWERSDRASAALDSSGADDDVIEVVEEEGVEEEGAGDELSDDIDEVTVAEQEEDAADLEDEGIDGEEAHD